MVRSRRGCVLAATFALVGCGEGLARRAAPSGGDAGATPAGEVSEAALSSTGFDPSLSGSLLFTAAILRGSSFTGAFASVVTLSAARGALSLVATARTLELQHNIADYNADGGVDGADLELYLIEWEAGELTTDANGDGGVDGADIESFITLWMQGGR